MITKYKVLESWKPRVRDSNFSKCSCAIHTSAILTNAKAKGNMNSCCTCKFLSQKDEKMTPSSEETHLLFHLGLSLSCTNTSPSAHVSNGCDASSALCTTNSCKWKVDWCRGGATWRFCIWSKAGQWHRWISGASLRMRTFVGGWISGRIFRERCGLRLNRCVTWNDVDETHVKKRHFWWVFWCAYCSHWLIPGLNRNCLLHEGVCMRGCKGALYVYQIRSKNWNTGTFRMQILYIDIMIDIWISYIHTQCLHVHVQNHSCTMLSQ